jgi:hypothetical protein
MSLLRSITDAFKSEFGRSKKSSVWPRCGACYRRTHPTGICRHSTHDPLCTRCCRFAGNHPAEERGDDDLR